MPHRRGHPLVPRGIEHARSAPLQCADRHHPGGRGWAEQSRLYLDLPDTRRLPLPYRPNLEEFRLPGNFRVYPQQHAFPVYDGTTRTGAVYLEDEQAWRLVQPVLRYAFWEFVEAQLRLIPVRDALASAADALRLLEGSSNG